MGIRVINQGHGGGPVIVACCPACGRDGTFERIGPEDVSIAPHYWLGQRRCPNVNCHSHLFFIWEKDRVISTFPPQRLDFEKQNIPQKVSNVFEEAISCHANECFVAAAMMIRRTLEEICLDRGAKGDDLKKRIESLKDKILIPRELLEGMDDLRLLGNDAAHIESKTFEQIGNEEVEVGIEFTKEILKAVYQYSHLLSKLKNLKKKEVTSAT